MMNRGFCGFFVAENPVKIKNKPAIIKNSQENYTFSTSTT